MGETGAVPGWSALITSVVMVGVLALLLRWAYGGRVLAPPTTTD